MNPSDEARPAADDDLPCIACGVSGPVSKLQLTELMFSTRERFGYRFDFGGLTFVHSGDTRAGWPLVRACEGGVDLLIHECFPPGD